MMRKSQTGAAAGSSQRVSRNAEINRNTTSPSGRGRGSCMNQQHKFGSLNELHQHLEEGVVAQPWMLSKMDTKEKWEKRK